MTRKDYELLANAVAMEARKGERSGWGSADAARAWDVAVTAVALNLADALERDNPHFNRVKFLAACGVG
jgi:hypothetical protein